MKSKSERHHWWPVCVSTHWQDAKGGVSWILPDGTVRVSTPDNFGVIGNGHIIKLGQSSSEQTVFDENFEGIFQNADNNFPGLIKWLHSLRPEKRSGARRVDRFVPCAMTDELFGHMIECLTSIAIRSPWTRSTCAAVAEFIQKRKLPERERNAIITLNMRHMHERSVRSFGLRGKVAAIFSPDKEFIFGDGFFHNVASVSGAQFMPRILAPITPRITLLYAVPRQYREDPRFSTIVINADEAEALNQVVQVYSKNTIFFRNEKPDLIPNYISGEHMQFCSSRNIVDDIVHSLPGVRSSERPFDFLDTIASFGNNDTLL